MGKIRIRTVAALLVAIALPAAAQEGFPLDGTWRGSWGPTGSDTHVVIVMSWDGERIHGMVNPGPQSFDFASAELDPSNWTVRIEAVDRDGVPVEIEGTLQNIGAYDRFITGTWSARGDPQPFRITRQ